MHVLLAVSGLVVWVLYLITDARQGSAITAALILVVVALLGLTMAIRWVAVYRAPGAAADDAQAPAAVPPERDFPLPVVIGHGIFAVTTVVLVLLTALGVGGG